ncbi:hypothetical protein [Streptomyces muensis]|uniref:Uncharacterized protein n=1 Tax=Streptomyces muensis TaxID=1077944 RepID=A0A9X1PVJ4_STRM4|nr:hypothetical protein [Streptomyces muensis]MCF1592518.1 hypothetical protein [Streptomyces muensis]
MPGEKRRIDCSHIADAVVFPAVDSADQMTGHLLGSAGHLGRPSKGTHDLRPAHADTVCARLDTVADTVGK